MAMAAAEPSPAAVMTWARGLATLPAAQMPGTLVRPVASVTHPAVLVEVAQPEVGQQVVVRHEPRWHEHGRAGDDAAVVQLDTAQAVVVDDDPAYGALDDADRRAASSVRWRPVSMLTGAKNTTSSVHWRTICAYRTASGVAADDAERLVPDLVSVAVRAVQHVTGPPLAQALDVGELVVQPGGDQHPPGGDPGHRRAAPGTRPPSRAEIVDGAVTICAAVARTSSRPAASSSAGGRPSRDRKPCMWAAGALRGRPASTTRTSRRARESTSAADRPAAPPPTTTTS